jgi:hypothetical protein
MGRIDEDKIFSIFIINSLGQHYPHLQSIIHGMTTDPNFTTAHALTCLETEAALEDRHAELGYQPSAVALIATNKEALSAPLICSNCKRLHHTINFCIKPSDRMAGKSLDEAKAAQCVAVEKPPHPPRTTPAPAIANVATCHHYYTGLDSPMVNTRRRAKVMMRKKSIYPYIFREGSNKLNQGQQSMPNFDL